MEEERAVDDSSFGNRVDRVFGSLGSVSWRLTDQQLQRNEWLSGRERRSSRDDAPCASSFQGLNIQRNRSRKSASSFRAGCDNDDDGDHSADSDDNDAGEPSDCGDRMDVEGEAVFRACGSLEDAEEEGRHMRGLVGLDATLDFEDEEDEFDKAAVGREGNDERLYMREVKSSQRKVDMSNSLPLSLYDLKNAPRDSRANHLAARARLQEDARDAAASIAYPERREKQDQMEPEQESLEDVEAKTLVAGLPPDGDYKETTIIGAKRSSDSWSKNADSQPSATQLSAKSEGKDKPVKRVRFALDFEHDVETLTRQEEKPRVRAPHASIVPDHVRNPSKYTHYTLDWSDEDNDKSNLEAFKACAEILKKDLEEGCEDPTEPLQRIRFIPRPSKASEAGQRSSVEEANHSLPCPIKITHCEDDAEKQSENLGTLSDAIIRSETEEAAAALDQISEAKTMKTPKRYRSKKGAAEAEDMMEM